MLSKILCWCSCSGLSFKPPVSFFLLLSISSSFPFIGSFSGMPWVNDIAGTFLHSFLLVPYFSWKWTHNSHHKNTANLQKDEIFQPSPSDSQLVSFFRDNYFLLGMGWFAYLLVGFRPLNDHCHFNPLHPIFKEKRRESQIFSSVIADLFMVWLLFQYASYLGWPSLIVDYLVPLFVFASWLVVVTFLHHHEEDVAWYNSNNWDYVKGNLSSVDRDYGFLHWTTHNIGTHQIHHLFPMIPHYHLIEASEHFKKAYPHLTHISNDSIISAYIKNCRLYATQYLPSASSLSFVYSEIITFFSAWDGSHIFSSDFVHSMTIAISIRCIRFSRRNAGNLRFFHQ